MTRPFTIIDCEQRSPEWFAARAGRLTASRAHDMLTKNKDGKWAASRRNLCAQLVLERVTGRPQENGYQSPAMLQGIEREADAIALYEALTGRLVRRSGFLAHTEHLAGCSLDAHVGDFERIVEAKSPTDAVHLDYLKSGRVPQDYLEQVWHHLWVTGAPVCDWISYNPNFPDHLQGRLVTIERDEKAIAAYEAEALKFLREVQTEYEATATLVNLPAVLKAAVA